MIIGAFMELILVLADGLTSGWRAEMLLFVGVLSPILGTVGGLLGGLIFGLMGGFNEIRMVDTLSWAWKKVIAIGLTSWLISGIGARLWFGQTFGWSHRLIVTGIDGRQRLSGDIVFGVFIGLIFGLILGLLFGLDTRPLNQKMVPGQKITLSIKNFLSVFILAGLISGVSGGMISWLFADLDSEWYAGLRTGIFSALIMGGIIGLRFGGFAAIRNHFLRFIIAKNNLLPWRLIPFLDYCVDLIFLRRLGGGYIFIHGLLMEHFAAMYSEGEKFE
jgi:hypothetical protein